MLISILLLGILGCASASSGNSADSGKKLMIRVRNESALNIENFWLGAGPRGGSTRNTSFGAIKTGETSRYHAVEQNLDNYRKMNFVANGKRYLGNIDPQNFVGQAELPLGWYTFAYNIVDGEPVLTIIEEPAQ